MGQQLWADLLQRDHASRFEATSGQELLVDVGRRRFCCYPWVRAGGDLKHLNLMTGTERVIVSHRGVQPHASWWPPGLVELGHNTAQKLLWPISWPGVLWTGLGLNFSLRRGFELLSEGWQPAFCPSPMHKGPIKGAVLEGGMNQYDAVICLSGFFKLISFQPISRERLNCYLKCYFAVLFCNLVFVFFYPSLS